MDVYWKGYTVVLVFNIPEFSKDISQIYTIRTGKNKQNQCSYCRLSSEIHLPKVFLEAFFGNGDVLPTEIFI